MQIKRLTYSLKVLCHALWSICISCRGLATTSMTTAVISDLIIIVSFSMNVSSTSDWTNQMIILQRYVTELSIKGHWRETKPWEEDYSGSGMISRFLSPDLGSISWSDESAENCHVRIWSLLFKIKKGLDCAMFGLLYPSSCYHYTFFGSGFCNWPNIRGRID